MSPKRVAKALAVFGTVALLVLLVLTVWVVRHRSSTQALQKVAGLVPGSLLHAHNFHWTQMKAGERQWVLTASDASYSADRRSLNLTGAEVTMVSTDGKPVKVYAPRAAIILDGNHITRADLSGGTTFHYGDYILSTDSLTFTPDNDQVEAPGAVSIEGDGLKVTGVGMSGHPKMREFVLHQNVSTEIMPKESSAKSSQS